MRTIFTRYSSVFLKYLLFYAIAFTLPLIVASSFLYGYFLSIYQNEVVSNHLNKLQQTMTYVDVQIEQNKAIADSIFMSPEFLPFNFEDNNIAGINAISELQKYVASDASISEIVYYSGSGDYLFSSDTSYTIDTFFYRNQYTGWMKESFLEDIRLNPGVTRPAEKISVYNMAGYSSTNRVTFIYPDSNPYFDRRVLIMVDNATLQSHPQQYDFDDEASTMLLDPDYRIISSSDSILDASSIVSQIDFSNTSGMQSITVDEIDILGLFYRSATTGWTYLAALDYDLAMKDVYRMQIYIIAGTALIIIIGLAMVWFFASRTYAPLRRLTETVSQDFRQFRSNEFQSIDKAITSLRTKNRHLADELEQSSDAVRNFLVYKLLKGSFLTQEAFNREATAQQMTLNGSLFRVIVFHGLHDGDAHSLSDTSIMQIISGCMPENCQSISRDYSEQDAVIIVLSYEPEAEESVQKNLFFCQDQLKKYTLAPITIGVSHTSNDISQIPKLYLQALTAVDYRLVQGVDRVIFYDDLVIKQSSFDQVFFHIGEKLSNLIRSGQSEQIENFLNNMVEYMRSNNTSIFVARSVCYDIVNTVIKTINEMSSERRISLEKYPSVFMITSFETADDLVSIIKQINHDLGQFFDQAVNHKKTELIEDMNTYINEHYADAEFSIQNMADCFQMSASNASIYYKKMSGLTILDKVTTLKIDHAKKLLSNSNMLIQDISMEVGYYNNTSFIRRFKQLTGITPGEYRNLQNRS